ncbi:MAG: hypothetical protein IJ809_05810, partial [Clostridia bacterium]|nr:hypothetical protein [Clostridia bacterium]
MLNIKKLFAIVLLIAVVVTTLPVVPVSVNAATIPVALRVTSGTSVNEGGTVTVNVTYGNGAIINLTAGHVGLYGFEGNVSISGTGNTRTITVSNVTGSGSGKYITVNAGSAFLADGTLADGVKSAFFTINSVAPVDTEAPVLTIAGPNAAEVTEGGSVSYELTYTDNVGIVAYNLTAGHIGLYGFEGNVSISGEGNVRTVTISNVKNVGEGKYITVNAGTAVDARGNLAN